MPFLLIGSVWHTFLPNSNPPVCWTLWVIFSSVFFFFLGSLFSRAAPSWQHMYTKDSWVLQIQVWIKVIRSCKAVFTNNTVTLIIECCEVGCCLKITVGYSVQPSAADEDSPLGGWFSGARRLICHIGTYKRHFFLCNKAKWTRWNKHNAHQWPRQFFLFKLWVYPSPVQWNTNAQTFPAVLQVTYVQ